MSYLVHGDDDFIEWDEVLVASESHVSAGESIGCCHDIFTEAGSFDSVCDRVTYHAEAVL